LNQTGRDTCRQLFLRLVTLGEGTEDTRRRVRRSELATLADRQTMDAVIETCGRHRLLSFDRDPDTREPTVEIAHEALLREWARLRAWIDDAREDLRQRARISTATGEWIQAERSSEYLLSGIRLAQAEDAIRGDSVRLTDNERDFIGASLAHRDAEAAAERMRHTRELALERRARTRLRGLVAVLAAGQVREVHLGVRHVGGDVDVRHGHHPHAGILDLVPQQVGELVPDLLGDALDALGLHSVLATSTTS